MMPFFSDIPFLPTSPALRKVHESLRSKGVHFDTLFTQSCHTQRPEKKLDGSLTNDDTVTVGSKASSTFSSNTNKSLALQSRISLICDLIDNDNTSVRKVALRHLIGLLRHNRHLFHLVVSNENSSSIRNYLTVLFEHSATKHANRKQKSMS